MSDTVASDHNEAPESPRRLRRELEHYRSVVEEMTRRIHSLEDELETATTMAEVTSVVVTRPELRNTLARLIKKVAMIIQAEKVLLMIHQPEINMLTPLPPAMGVTQEQSSQLTVGLEDGVAGWVFRNRESVVYNDALNDPRTSKEIVSLLAIRNGITVPLVIKQRDEEERLVDERVIGVMHVFNKRFDEDFSTEDMRLLEMLAEQAAAVISNAQLYIQLTEEKEELQDAFASIHVGVIVVNRHGIVRLLNPAAAEMLTMPADDYSGQPLPNVVPPGEVHDLVKSALKGTSRSLSAPGEAGEAPPAILVAEDSITSRALLKNILTAAGYAVHTAADGREAWETLSRGEISLVVSDVEMPGMNGFELTSKIRSEERLSDLPVILVTSLESAEDRERGVVAGADAYIVKSGFDQGALLDVIRRLL